MTTLIDIFKIKKDRLKEIIKYVENYLNEHKEETDMNVIDHFAKKFNEKNELAIIMFIFGFETSTVNMVNCLERIFRSMGLKDIEMRSILEPSIIFNFSNLLGLVSGEPFIEEKAGPRVHISDTEKEERDGHAS